MKNLKTISMLILLVLAGVFAKVQAQETPKIADGSAISGQVPIVFMPNTAYYSQVLYPTSYLTAIPDGAKITKMTFYATTNYQTVDVSASNVLVAMGSASSIPISTTALTTVYQGTVTLSGGLLTIAFPTTPFEYKGGDLVLHIEYPSQSSMTFKETAFQCATTTANQALYDDGWGVDYQKRLPTVTIGYTVGSSGHTITAVAPQNGTIMPSDATPVADGANQPYTITPATGYKINNVMDGSTNITTGVVINAGTGVGTYTFSNVKANHTISATFIPIEYSITYNNENSATNPNVKIYTIE